ncbi:hypothetical protein KIPB_004729 [Kipferlia bialata]|uniref:Uncharacterized protein n=1 Tax=Kipferlia bialata TaxID=797122 RepID=A0A9K3GI07_9EUKA|nr:hypothetical protein KIPB_004729 [Kipferlia bialata]|eukprot:g4729.t1
MSPLSDTFLSLWQTARDSTGSPKTVIMTDDMLTCLVRLQLSLEPDQTLQGCIPHLADHAVSVPFHSTYMLYMPDTEEGEAPDTALSHFVADLNLIMPSVTLMSSIQSLGQVKHLISPPHGEGEREGHKGPVQVVVCGHSVVTAASEASPLHSALLSEAAEHGVHVRTFICHREETVPSDVYTNLEQTVKRDYLDRLDRGAREAAMKRGSKNALW